jgi:hypothetical protein
MQELRLIGTRGTKWPSIIETHLYTPRATRSIFKKREVDQQTSSCSATEQGMIVDRACAYMMENESEQDDERGSDGETSL